VKWLDGTWEGFIEIKKEIKTTQYRLIGQIENRNVFLVTTGFHQGIWKADITRKTGDERVALMKNNPLKHRREHDFS
jgi:hypothetical protein